jgi:hypothetical protein
MFLSISFKLVLFSCFMIFLSISFSVFINKPFFKNFFLTIRLEILSSRLSSHFTDYIL